MGRSMGWSGGEGVRGLRTGRGRVMAGVVLAGWGGVEVEVGDFG